MKIIKVNYKNPNLGAIKEMARVIRGGGIVIAPTPTVYGIFADALNKKTVDKVLRLKERNKDKGFDLTLYPEKEIFKYIQYHFLIDEIVKKFPDEAFSFATPKKKLLPKFLSPGFKTAAFHFFFSELDKKLFKWLKTPLIGTSANISQLPDTHSMGEIVEYFKHTFHSSIRPDLILDAGEIPSRKSSAIIELVGERVSIIREGEISKIRFRKEIEKLLKIVKTELKFKVGRIIKE